MTNYQSALTRLRKASTVEDLKKLDKSFTRIYDAGFFTVSEYARLDAKLFDKKLALIDTNQ